MRAGSWSELSEFYSSAGFSDERVWLYLARELDRSTAVPSRGGRADRDRAVAAGRLGEAISECQDAKSLIALLWLAGELARGTL